MNYDELAESLRVSFRGPLVEADEWRPLAEYIHSLLEAQREACAARMRRAVNANAEHLCRATPLVTDEDAP